MCCKGVRMSNTPIKDPSSATKLKASKKPKKQCQLVAKEILTPLSVVEAMEKKIKHHSLKDKKALLDERTLNPRAKKLLEELSTELGLSKEMIAELAITLYRLYKDKA